MANPAPIISQINAFNATEGTIISFNIVGGTSIVRSNIIYIYDLSDNSLICTHLYISTESIHELPANTDPSIVYASGKSSADFTNGKQYYAQIQTFTNTAGTEGASGASIAKLFWCLVDPTLTINTIPSSISTTSYNVGAVYNSNTTATSNIVQQYQFNLYSATGVLVQSSGVITGSGTQQGTSTAYDLSYNFTGLNVGSSYYVTAEVTTTQGMTVSAQSSTFTVSIDTPTLGEATVVNNACDGYISVTSNLSSEYGGSGSGDIVSFETDSENVFTKLQVDLEPIQDLHGYDKPWVGGAGVNKYNASAQHINTGASASASIDGDTITATANNGALVITGKNAQSFPAGTYTCSAIGTNADGFVIWRYTVANNTETQVGSMSMTRTFTANEPFYLGVSITSAKWGQTVVGKIQLETGSTATAYSPYTNICPISGWDEVETVVSGKNWLPVSCQSTLRHGITYTVYKNDSGAVTRIHAEGTSTASHSYTFVGGHNADNPFRIKAGSYWLKALSDGRGGSFDFNIRKIGQTQDIVQVTDKVPLVLDEDTDFQSCYLYVYSGKTLNTDIYPMVWSQSETSDDYEPYQGHTYTTDLPQTVYGGTLDVVSGVLTVDRAMVDLGSLNWSRYDASSDAVGTQSIYGTTGIGTNVNVEVNPICSNYQGAYRVTSNTAAWQRGNGTCSFLRSGDMRFYVRDDSLIDKTPTEFKTAMSGVQLCYELATPRTIQLDPQSINTLVGVNNVWADSGDVSVTYNIPITNLLVKRQDTADISGKWLTLYSQPITQASDMDFTFIDFLNQYGKTYKYALVPLLTQEQSGVEVEVEGGYTVSDEVVSIFDGVFVADNTAIYKLKAGVNYGDLSKVQEVGSINTIGSQYPIIVSNSKVDYRTASLSATIVADDYYDNGNLNRMDMVQKRELMESFFVNKRAKILKDWNGNIWLVVFIDNINITFINEYGMGIATLTATWTEIGDVTSEEDLQNTRIINVG